MPFGRNLGMREPVQIFAQQGILNHSIVLYTNDQRIPHYSIPMMDLAYGDNRMMESHLNHYIKAIIIGQGYATRDEIDVRLPNLFRYPAQAERERNLAKEQKRLAAMQQAFEEQERKRKADGESYEVNMVECLVGWKTWKWEKQSGRIVSPSQRAVWEPDVPLTASCGHEKISSSCQCGIYAADDRNAASQYSGQIHGRIHGWGRYIRGDKGWRAQFAYPREFHLQESQMDLIDKLRVYHVPIYIAQPLRVYDPTEDGYDGHWNAEENGDGGTCEESDSKED